MKHHASEQRIAARCIFVEGLFGIKERKIKEWKKKCMNEMERKVENYINPKYRNVKFRLFGSQEFITQESQNVVLIEILIRF